MATIFRSPILTRIVAKSALAAIIATGPPNLLTTTLRSQDNLLIRQNNWPNPLIPRRPNVGSVQSSPRYYLGLDNLLIRQNNWPNPLIAKRAHTGFTHAAQTKLIGKDNLLIRKLDWPNPIRNRFVPTQDQVNSLNSLLGVVTQKPFSKTDWPNPILSYKLNTGFIDSFKLNLIGQDNIIPRQNDWPNPLIRKFVPTQDQVNDLNSLLIVVAQNPFNQSQWNNPTRALFNRIQTHVSGNPIGGIQPFNQLDWPNPTRAKLNYELRTWINSYVVYTLTPFIPVNWSNPLIPYKLNTGFVDSLKLNLIGKDFLPFRQLDWQNPIRPIWVINNLTLTVDLLQTTLIPVVVPGSGFKLVLIHGRLARQLSGMIYEWV